jgi:hypothetical protein
MPIKLRGRWYRLRLERWRTISGSLRVALILTYWPAGLTYKSISWPLRPLSWPFKH